PVSHRRSALCESYTLRVCRSVYYLCSCLFFFFFNDPPPTDIYTLSLHDALPISRAPVSPRWNSRRAARLSPSSPAGPPWPRPRRDRKSTRLNSSHGSISYAVFCLKKKKKK